MTSSIPFPRLTSGLEPRPFDHRFVSKASASSVKLSSLPSHQTTPCLIRAFFGSVRTEISPVWPSGVSAEQTGSLPDVPGSGRIPECRLSSLVVEVPRHRDLLSTRILAKPMVFPRRLRMMSSTPTMSCQMNRMLLVSIWIYCCSGACDLRGGTSVTVPSSILSKGLLNPSPETSRVIETFWLVLPPCRSRRCKLRLVEPSQCQVGRVKKFEKKVFDISPT